MQNNNLSGIVPSELSSKFNATSFNLNCLSNYTTQPWCPLPYLQLQALTDLYIATGGSGWRVSTRWLTGDPCLNTWFGVSCNAPANTSITYAFHDMLPCMSSILQWLINARMYVYMHVCMHVCVHVCMFKILVGSWFVFL